MFYRTLFSLVFGLWLKIIVANSIWITDKTLDFQPYSLLLVQPYLFPFKILTNSL